MAELSLGEGEALYFEHQPAAEAGAPTFVFVNPITGDVGLWNQVIVPALTGASYGTLGYNFRGQAKSRFAPGRKLDAPLIVADLQALLANVGPNRPILVGLSIGGLYAARAVLAGSRASGLVLINTLRRITPRIAWMNDASLRVMQVGGPNLMKDLYFHLLVGEDYQRRHRGDFLRDDSDYQPLAQDSGAYNLLTWMGQTDWDLDWSGLTLPTLVVTGTQDRVFYEPAIVEELFAALPQGRRVDMTDAGHMLPLETPEPLIAALQDFAESLRT